MTVLSTVSLAPLSKSFGTVILRYSSESNVQGFYGDPLSSIHVSSAIGNSITLDLPESASGSVADKIELTMVAGRRMPPRVSAMFLRVSPRTGEFRYADKSGNGFSQSTIEDWFAALGLSSQDTVADAAELFALIDACAQGQPSFTMTRYRSVGAGGVIGGREEAHSWQLELLLVLFWLSVYIGGIVLYYHRLRRADHPAL